MSSVAVEQTDLSCQLIGQTVPNAYANHRLVLRRGSQRMILFTACPGRSVVRSLRRAGSMIGLVVSSGERTMMDTIDDYDYVYIHLNHQPAEAIACALRDLVRNNWTRVRELAELGPWIRKRPASKWIRNRSASNRSANPR